MYRPSVISLDTASTYIIDQGTTLHVYVFPVKRFLQQLDDIVSNRVLRRKSLCPGQEFAGVDGGLFDGKTGVRRCQGGVSPECETQMQRTLGSNV